MNKTFDTAGYSFLFNQSSIWSMHSGFGVVIGGFKQQQPPCWSVLEQDTKSLRIPASCCISDLLL